MHLPLPILLTPLLFPILTLAQFGQFFEHMFSGGGGSHGGHNHHHQEPDAPSDAAWYKKMYEGATCSKYLCPGTLSCVDKPTHCPCAFPDIEEKFELHGSGIAVCLSKSLGNGRPEGGNEGWEKVRESLKSGKGSDTQRKVELARKGLL